MTRTQPSRRLVVAPYVGEFGWELMNWQGRVRWIVSRNAFDQVLLFARPDRRSLCGDLLSKQGVVFCPMPPHDVPGEANDDHRIDGHGHQISAERLRTSVIAQVRRIAEQLAIDTAGAEILTPTYTGTIWPTTRQYQLFKSLRVQREITSDIVLIPRNRRVAAERNCDAAFWRDLADGLAASGCRVEMYEPRLDRAILQLSRTRLAVGASTGGLHLAGLCGCPHYVWGSGPADRWTAMQITNRQRYETIWNPLGTPCRYDECGWSPPVKCVVEQTLRALREIGIHSSRRARRPFRSAWRIKRGLARLLEPQARYGLCPWRIRRLVREHLV